MKKNYHVVIANQIWIWLSSMYQVKFQIFMKLNDVSLLIKETYCSYEIEEVSNVNRIKEKSNDIYGTKWYFVKNKRKITT